MDLTGIWPERNGGIYAVRQIGRDIWWVGMSDTYAFRRGVTWTNVFHGTINGSIINGSWMDVPRGATVNGGMLELVVIDPNLAEPVPPRQLKQLAEHIARQQQSDAGSAAATTPAEPLQKKQNGPPSPPPPPPSPRPLHMIARTVSGGFGGSQWSRTGDPAFQLDIHQRFDSARRNDDGSMHDHLKMYKDCVVIVGTAANGPTSKAGLLWPFRRNYPDFIDACNRWRHCGINDDPPDGDVNFDIQVDRVALNAQPGIWTDGWLNDMRQFRTKLDDKAVTFQLGPFTFTNVSGHDTTTANMLHCEAIMFGRTGDADHANDPGMLTVLPGWGETGGNSVLINGQPAAVTPTGPLPADTDTSVPVNVLPNITFSQDQRVRVSGFFALDCHGLGGDCFEDLAADHNAEIHPVYAIDLFQDFNNRGADANLSGVWHCATDVGTYYLRQDGQQVWWFGISRDDGAGFANVFHGTLRADLLTGSAIDVPLRFGAPQNSADLNITCQGGLGGLATRLVSNGPAWDAYQWEKIYDTMPFPLPIFVGHPA
jgi:hypothetical protein